MCRRTPVEPLPSPVVFFTVFSLYRRLCLIGWFVAASVLARANDAVPFSQILTPDERTAVGYSHLSGAQVDAIDTLVARDLTLARQGDVVAFAKGFTDRRAPEERVRAGIDQLTPDERARLDALVATVIAARPMTAVFQRAATDSDAGAVKRLPSQAEVHGSVSLFYGRSSGGGSLYGGSVDTWITDPTKRWTLGVGYSEVHTNGMRRECGW